MPVARARPGVAAERRRVLGRLELRYAIATGDYFRGMTPRILPGIRTVAARFVDQAATKAEPVADPISVALETIEWDAETRILSTLVRPVSLLVGDVAAAAVGRELGISETFDRAPAPASLSAIGRRISTVAEVSRERIAREIRDGVTKGLSVEQIVKGVRPGTTNIRAVPAFRGVAGLVDEWSSTGTPGFAGRVGAVPLRSSRAYLIALTETGNAYNSAAIDRYRDSGIVDAVEVFDGPDCGWVYHDDPDLAHGSFRTLDQAKAHPLSHPRCQRAFGAAIGQAVAKPSPFARGGAVPGATPGVGAVNPRDEAALALSGAGSAIPTAAVARASQMAIETARFAEPGISRSLLATTNGQTIAFEDAMLGRAAPAGGDLAGFAARKKTLTSLSRKIDTDVKLAARGNPPVRISADQAADAIADKVRYTLRFNEADYWSGVRDASERLVAEGNVPIKWKPTWDSATYRGLNTQWRAPNGTTFEVQFHTPTSFVTKELNHHPFEEARLLTTSAARRAELDAEMAARAKAVPIPPGEWVSLEDVRAIAGLR